MEPEHTASGRARAKSAKIIETGAAVLGIELGSTRIKACLIAPDGVSLATGSSEWENRWSDGHWTYGLDEVWDGMAAAFADLRDRVRQTYGCESTLR